MPDSNIKSILDKSEAKLKENGFNSDADAYKKLYEEAQSLEFKGQEVQPSGDRQRQDGTSSQESHSIDTKSEIRNGLLERQILPDLCIGFLKHNFLELDKNSDGKITLEELHSYHAGDQSWWSRMMNANNGDTIEQILVEELTDSNKTFKTIAASDAIGSPDAIEMNDLLVQSKQRLQSIVKEESRTLFERGASSWMALVDEKDGQYDGYASVEDIQKRLSQARPGDFSTLGSKIDAKTFLQELAEGKHSELLRDGSLDVVAIMKKAGLNPTVVNSREDYSRINEDLSFSPDRSFSKWLTKDKQVRYRDFIVIDQPRGQYQPRGYNQQR